MSYKRMSAEELPLISIVVAVFNGVDTVEKLLSSVIECTYKNLDLIIMDGGSTDGTLEILEKYNGYIRYWRSERDGGIYDALNKAMSFCEVGSYVLVLGADDKLLDIQPVIDSIIRDSADVLVTNVQQRDIKSNVTTVYKCFLPEDITNYNFLSFPLHHQGFIFRIPEVDFQGFCPELGLHSDYEFMARTLRTARHAVFIDVLLSEYSTGGASDYFSWKNLRSLGCVARSLGLSRVRIVVFSPVRFLRMLFKLVLPIGCIDLLRRFFRS
jgi:glycosyltransferase involved in cell wall biosynthesis